MTHTTETKCGLCSLMGFRARKATPLFVSKTTSDVSDLDQYSIPQVDAIRMESIRSYDHRGCLLYDLEMNCIHILYTKTFGGPHNQVAQLATASDGRTHVIVAPKGIAKFEAIADEKDIFYYPLALWRPTKRNVPTVLVFPLILVFDCLRLAKTLKRHLNGETVVINYGSLYLTGLVFAKIYGLRSISEMPGLFTPKPFRKIIGKVHKFLADKILFTGKKVANAYGLEINGSNKVYFPPIREVVIANESQREGILTIGTLGNRNWQKAHERCVDIAKALKAQGVPFKWIIQGRDSKGQESYYQSQVIDKAVDFGLEELHFETTMSPKELFSKIDLFVLTSKVEGLPTVILESCVNGVPALSLPVGAIEELTPIFDNLSVLQDTDGIASHIIDGQQTILANRNKEISYPEKLRKLEEVNSLFFKPHYEALDF